MNTDKLLKEFDDMSLFTFNIEYEMAENVIMAISGIINAKYDKFKLENALSCMDKNGSGQLYISYGVNDSREFVLLDCYKGCYLYSVTARCSLDKFGKLIEAINPYRTEIMKNLGFVVIEPPKDLYHCEVEYVYTCEGEREINPVKSSLQLHGII